MGKIEFDANGNLKPYQAVECSLDDLKLFVSEHKEDNIRHELFAKYEAFLEVLNSEITSDFVQFIDGSFVSKKSHPRDMDIVTFIDYKIFELKEGEIRKLKKAYKKLAIDNYLSVYIQRIIHTTSDIKVIVYIGMLYSQKIEETNPKII